jgi:hypothetical protein
MRDLQSVDRSDSTDRRTLLKAAAWGSGAVLFTVAVPAASASPIDLSGESVTVSMTSGGYQVGVNATSYQWALANDESRPKVTWQDSGLNNWNTGQMTATYVVSASTIGATRISLWSGCTPYKLNSDTQTQATNVSSNASVLAVGDVIETSDGYVWTCDSITQTGSGTTLNTKIVFTSPGATSLGSSVNIVFLPRIGLKLDYKLSSGTSAQKPFKATLDWTADNLPESNPDASSLF